MAKRGRGAEASVDEEYEGKLRNARRHGRRRHFLEVMLILLAVVVVILIVIWQKMKSYTEYKVIKTVESSVDAESEYVRLGDDLLRVNNDGISCYTSKGLAWNQAYEMQRVSVDISGSYIAVGEVGAGKLYVYSADGTANTVQTTYPIVKVEVASQGVTAALTEDAEANYIEVMDKENNQLVTGRTVLEGNGYPLDFSLSSDGTKMIVSYLYVSGGITQSKIVFYNFSEVGKNEVDRMVGVYNNYDGMIVPMVEFIGDDAAIAVADSGITFYQMGEKPSEEVRVELDGEIKKICTGSQYVGVIYGADNQVAVYNKKGKEIFTQVLDINVDKMYFSGNRLLLLAGEECVLLNRSGKQIFSYLFENGMMDMIPLDGDKFLLVSNDGVQQIRLK